MLWGSKSVGAEAGFENVAVYFSSLARDSRALSALLSPPRWGEVASGMPSSDRVGTAKSLFGPEREA